MRHAATLAGALLVLVATGAAAAEPLRLAFASVEEGQALLGQTDAYIAEMSALDRALRMRTDLPVSTEQFLAHVRRQVLAWDAAERPQVEAALRALEPALARLPVTLPAPIHLVKTTGAEDADSPYTRGRAIVLPRRVLGSSNDALQEILAHELLHILTRHDPALRDALYEAIGFRRCGRLELPPALRPLKVTNPDALEHEHCIRLGRAETTLWAIPMLVARTPRYDPARRGSLLESVRVVLLVVTPGSETEPARVRLDAQAPPLLPSHRSDFVDQVGENTRYLAHAEEIVADNFALLVRGARDVPSPAVLERLREVFARRARGAP